MHGSLARHALEFSCDVDYAVCGGVGFIELYKVRRRAFNLAFVVFVKPQSLVEAALARLHRYGFGPLVRVGVRYVVRPCHVL